MASVAAIEEAVFIRGAVCRTQLSRAAATPLIFRTILRIRAEYQTGGMPEGCLAAASFKESRPSLIPLPGTLTGTAGCPQSAAYLLDIPRACQTAVRWRKTMLCGLCLHNGGTSGGIACQPWGSLVIPSFNGLGHLPVGRYSCSPEEAEAFLVANPMFANSQTRADLWDNLLRYLANFFALEVQNTDIIDGRLLERFWLGGSFVSDKVDPRNVDVTLLLNAQAKRALRGRPGAGIFTRSRRNVLADYQVSPLFLDYRPVVSVFKLDELEESEREYLMTRGAWDDWWQRTRLPNSPDRQPSLESCPPRRGYLEVIL